MENESKNPHYLVYYDEKKPPISCYSKTYDDISNPKKNFIAIMTCNHADQNCPYITGADKRIATPYEDPKKYDGTPLEEAKYFERCQQIARESLFIFDQVEKRS